MPFFTYHQTHEKHVLFHSVLSKMFKDFLILSTVFFLLFSCSKKEEVKIASKENNEEKVLYIYNEAIDALKVGDAFFAKKK